jgi:hypothetical protein
LKKRIITALLVGTGVFGAVIGLAASLTVNSDQLGSGSAAVSSCDSDGVTTSYTYNALGGVSAVVVDGIQDGSAIVGSGACDGETVYVELLDSSSAVITGATGSTTVTGDVVDIADGSATVPMGTPAPAASVTSARVTITG